MLWRITTGGEASGRSIRLGCRPCRRAPRSELQHHGAGRWVVGGALRPLPRGGGGDRARRGRRWASTMFILATLSAAARCRPPRAVRHLPKRRTTCPCLGQAGCSRCHFSPAARRSPSRWRSSRARGDVASARRSRGPRRSGRASVLDALLDARDPTASVEPLGQRLRAVAQLVADSHEPVTEL
jgi:hypothetical protein